MLAGLVEEGKMTDEEAALMVQAFDAGELTAADLPLSTAEQGGGSPTEEESAVIVLAALIVRRAVVTSHPVDDAAAFLRNLTDAERTQRAKRRSDLFEAQSANLAARLKDGTLTMRQWHVEMSRLIKEDLLIRAALGKGALLTEEETLAVEAQFTEQAAYLQRFAETVALREALDSEEESGIEAMSEEAVAARAGLYAGAGYAAYWTWRTLSEARSGLIIRYRSQDAPSTCPPCLAADLNGPYVSSKGYPVPGAVCLGGGRCKCELEYEYNLEKYAELIGQARENVQMYSDWRAETEQPDDGMEEDA